MKTNLKKYGVFAILTAALLISVVLVTACNSPKNSDNGPTLPPGTGYVRINFSDTLGRTILPTNTGFGQYDLIFQQVNADGSAIIPTPPSAITQTKPHATTVNSDPLPLGYYTLKVVAYVTNKLTGDDAAEGIYDDGTDQHFEVITSGATISVNLELYDPVVAGTAGGTGTFETDPIFTGSASGSIDIRPISGSYSDSGSFPYSNTSIPAGYYYVDYIITLGAETITFTQVLHVYQSLVSSFDPTFEDDIFTTGPGPGTGWAAITITPPVFPTEGISISPGPTTLSISGGDVQPFTASASGDWYLNNAVIYTGTLLIVEAGVAPFDEVGDYLVYVIGTPGGKPYSASVKITIEP